jgi:thiol-disulfide isomerase/thioredoxin
LAQRRADQRKRARSIIASVVGVAVLLGAIAAYVILHKSTSANDRTAASPAVVSAVTNVSDATLTKIGEGNVLTPPAPVTGHTPLVANGKPELLYIGAEFCPYCAVERWSLTEALSKFGTFANLSEVHSAVDDGNFASLDFYKSTYTSKYLTFTAIENEDRSQKPLQSVTSAQNTLWKTLSGGAQGFPFIDFGNKLLIARSAPLDPSVLGSSTQVQIAAQLDDPNSKIAQTVGGGANDDIAAICTMTGNQPAKVCSSSVIKGLQAKLGATASS